MQDSFEIYSLGTISTKADHPVIMIKERYCEAILGLEGFSHIQVLYWLHQNDDAAQRNILRVYPRGKRSNPLSGVFATRSPVRPNPIAVSICRVLSIKETRIVLDQIDALDGSPVIDIKCHIPKPMDESCSRVPDWV